MGRWMRRCTCTGPGVTSPIPDQECTRTGGELSLELVRQDGRSLRETVTCGAVPGDDPDLSGNDRLVQHCCLPEPDCHPVPLVAANGH